MDRNSLLFCLFAFFAINYDVSTGSRVNDVTEIHKLNDDCLMNIFSYIPRGNRIVLEKVCRRWETVSRLTWRNFKKFDLKEKTWGDNSTCENLKLMKMVTLNKVLYRCGSYLTHIDFSERTRYISELDGKVVSVFAQHCENLQHIDITNSNSCEITHDPSYEKELSKLFLNNKKLRSLRLKDTAITGECLLNLSADSLEILIITISYNISPCYLERVVKKFRKLHTLSLTYCTGLTYKTFNTICFHAESLKALQFREYPRLKLENYELLQMKGFSNLIQLDVHTNNIDDQTLKVIGEKCKELQIINLSENFEISNEGLVHIVTLPKLQQLFIKKLPKITDAIFTDMPNLRILDCTDCGRVKNQGLCRLIRKSHYLEFLNVVSCEKVSYELVKVAITAAKNRTNNVILKMHVSLKGIDVDYINAAASPFLQLTNFFYTVKKNGICYKYL